jgi:hypothetical protein
VANLVQSVLAGVAPQEPSELVAELSEDSPKVALALMALMALMVLLVLLVLMDEQEMAAPAVMVLEA